MKIAIYVLLYTMIGGVGAATLFLAAMIVLLVAFPKSFQRMAERCLAKREESA